MTTAKQRRKSNSESHVEQHLKLLEELNGLPLSDSCCEICHCDCYNSHRSCDLSVERSRKMSGKAELQLRKPTKGRLRVSSSEREPSSKNSKRKPTIATKTKVKKKPHNAENDASVRSSEVALPSISRNKVSCKSRSNPPATTEKPRKLKRSKSASSIHGSNQLTNYTRDCKVLQDLFAAFEQTPALELKPIAEGAVEAIPKTKVRSQQNMHVTPSCSNRSSFQPWPSLSGAKQSATALAVKPHTTLAASTGPLKLCASMANLCLTPTVRQAFQRVPMHDKKILNRMATKRSEQAAAKETAWLARKYWENERYERELLKCEQMEEYKRAVRDKQFRDYLLTKARLNKIAQRDLAELQHLRESLQEKDALTKRRLDAIRVERDIQLCQRRCDELRRSEAVNVQQEEHLLDNSLRKQEQCERLMARRQRADQLRSQLLESYLKRLRYDNYVEHLLHEEHWREAQDFELQKRERLKEHISRKCNKSKRFIEQRQKHKEALTKTAMISAGLRELVRNSVTPDGALMGEPAGTSWMCTLPAIPISLQKLLLDKPISELSVE